jgi:hypothetical protein
MRALQGKRVPANSAEMPAEVSFLAPSTASDQVIPRMLGRTTAHPSAPTSMHGSGRCSGGLRSAIAPQFNLKSRQDPAVVP